MIVATVHPWHLVNCINTEYTSQAHTWEEVLTDTGSSDGVVPLGVLGAWWTSKPSKLPVTLSTHVSATRLYQLHAQCLSWPGPISAAVYLNLFEPKRPVGGQMNLSDVSLAKLRGSIRAVEDLAKEMEASGDDACQLDVMLVFEIFTDKKGALLYPFNILRNFARLQARTQTMGLLDIDMLAGPGLAQSLKGVAGKALVDQLANTKKVMVIPAFQTTKHANQTAKAAILADTLASMDKQDFILAVSANLAEAFDLLRYPPGHNWTLYPTWWTAAEAYTIEPGKGYEPWILADRKQVPWHDVRYRGYGWDKVAHISLLNASRFEFLVHPTAFCIHRNHPHTEASTSFFKTYGSNPSSSPEGLAIRDRNQAIFEYAKGCWDKGDVGTPVLDWASVRCVPKLPWWRDGWKEAAVS
ncbi:MAG: hypothetical protein WDW38_001847 [Sanguina aurantia]